MSVTCGTWEPRDDLFQDEGSRQEDISRQAGVTEVKRMKDFGGSIGKSRVYGRSQRKCK